MDLLKFVCFTPDDLEDKKESNKRVYLKMKGKAIKKRETSDDEIDRLIQDKRKSDEEENALMNFPDKKESNKRARSKSARKLLKSKKNRVGHKETSNEDGDNLLMEDDRKSDEENVLVSPAKKRGSKKRVRTSTKRKPIKAKKRKLDVVEASDDEGPHDTDISMQEVENSKEEENISENLIDKRESCIRAPSQFKKKPVKEKLESASSAVAYVEEDSGNHVESPMDDDNRSDEEENPPLGEADREESNLEITGSKPVIQGKTKRKSPDPYADEKSEIPDDEPLVLALGPPFKFILVSVLIFYSPFLQLLI